MSGSGFDLEDRIRRLERRYRAAVSIAVISSACGFLALLMGTNARADAAPTSATANDVIPAMKVRQLDVVDEKGVTRVRLGAPLAHAVVDGKQNRSRGGNPEDTVSGILLFDAEGIERSGYVTVDRGYSNVLLTLDDKHKQHAMFIAEPTGATTLRLFNGDTKDRVDVSINSDGPSITMMRRGQETYRFPPRE